MPRITQQQRLIAALIATGPLKRPDGTFFYVGKAGALRFGKTITASIAAPDDFKRRLLEENAP